MLFICSAICTQIFSFSPQLSSPPMNCHYYFFSGILRVIASYCAMWEEKWFCLLSSLWTEKFTVLHHLPSLVTYSCWTLACRQRSLLWLGICFSDFQKALLIPWTSMNSEMSWPLDRVFWSFIECENGRWVPRILFGPTCWESSHWVLVAGIEFSVTLTPIDSSELKQISVLLILIFELWSWSWLKFLLRLTFSSPANLWLHWWWWYFLKKCFYWF